jgi:hypothetical protein
MPTETSENPNARMYANEAERQKRARQVVEERTAATAQRVQERAQIEEQYRPTLTQLENDLVAVGVTLPDPPADETAEPGGPKNRDVPYVSGTGTVGETLSCTMGNWDGEPTSYAYQWKRDGTLNLGTDSSYQIVAGDAGHSLTCVVTATNARGSTAAPPSNAITVAGAAATAAPTRSQR